MYKRVKGPDCRHNDHKSLSKWLSWLLRHGAITEGLNIGTDGFVDVTDIEQHRRFHGKFTVTDIQCVVAENDKQRFTLRTHPVSGKLQIKANQGHSIHTVVDPDLVPILHASEIPTVIHGTYFENWTKIKTEGLSRMNRLHIHFSPEEPGDSPVVSGMRSSCQLYIYIDTEKALRDGIPFYRSVNNVILSPGNSCGYIEPKYFSKVIEVSTKSYLSSDISDIGTFLEDSSVHRFGITMQNSTKCAVCNVYLPDATSWKAHLLGRKHLRGLHLEEQRRNAEHKGIYVKGFPRHTDQLQVKDFFSTFGPIKKFVYGSQGTFAIIQFCNRRDAQFCLSNKLSYYGCPLIVSRQRIPDTVGKGSHVPQSVGLNHQQVMTALSSCEDNFQSQLSALLNEIHLLDNRKYILVCKDLEDTFSASSHGCKAHPFGSAVTGLAFKGSDLDVFMDLNVTPAGGSASTPISESSDSINHAKRLLQRRRNEFTSVFAIPKAKTPIVKFIHKPTGISCDLSFKNSLGVNNSALIRLYLSMDPRIQPFLIIIKYWAKKNDLSGHGKISNYALVMVALFYVQQLEDPIIPAVTTLQEGVNNKVIIAGWDCSVNTSISSQTSNTMSVPELLCGFFKFYSLFDYGMKVICPLTGTSLPKLMFQTPEELPEAMHRYKEYVSISGSGILGLKVDCDMCVQDPFELQHNITAGMSAKALDNFKKYCEAAAQACVEELSTDSGAPTFLKRLLDEKTKPLDLSSQITIPLGKYLTYVLPGNCSTQQEGSANIEDELRKGWYKSVLKFLLEIFEDVMKFNVEVEESEHNSKVRKMEGCSDVSEQMKVIHCAGYCRVWEGRKAASKKVSFPENMVTITKERIISDFIVAQCKEQSSTCNPVTTFQCLFHPERQPTRVTLELHDKKSDKGSFKALVGFMHGRLPAWIEKCLIWQQNEQVVKKEVQMCYAT